MNPRAPEPIPQADTEPVPNELEERGDDILADHLDEPKREKTKLPADTEELKDLANDAEGG